MLPTMTGKLSMFTAFSSPLVLPINQQSPIFVAKHRQVSSREDEFLHAARYRMVSSEPTPLERMVFRDRVIYVKRDDMLAFRGVMGSKFRKFYTLLQAGALDDFDGIVSYGGAQSNAMFAVASLCSFRQKQFVYITRKISQRLRTAPGNYKEAVSAGMIHVQLGNEEFRDAFIDKDFEDTRIAASVILRQRGLFSSLSQHLFLPQGGAWPGAEEGIRRLAVELRTQISQLRENGAIGSKIPILFLPAGTGTTAFFLQKHLYGVARVVAIPVSGDERYLMKQMRALHRHCDAEQSNLQAPALPDVIRPRSRSTFGNVTSTKLSLWKELARAAKGKVIFDLVYAPKAWEEAMLAIAEGRLGEAGEEMLYYHSGGLEGNQSMLDRFRSKGILDVSA